MDEASVRGLLETAIGDEPPLGPVVQNSLRAGLKLRRRVRIRRAAGGTAAVIVFAAVIPAAVGTLGNTSAAGHHGPGASAPSSGTAYVINSGGGTVTPIDLATSTAEKPIDVSGEPVTMAIAPDGKTAYVGSGATTAGAGPTSEQTVTPIDLATNTAGKPIDLQYPPDGIVITPDGKTAYVLNGFPSLTLTPVDLATNRPGKPIKLPDMLGALPEVPEAIAMAPDGKAYVAIQTDGRTSQGFQFGYYFMSIDLATGRLGKPVKLLSGYPDAIAITPDGKTAYVTGYSSDTVTPINLSTNRAGRLIKISGKAPGNHFSGLAFAIAITPDGKTAYVTNGASGTVTPIDVATNMPGWPIKISGKPGADAIAISPDGTTAYVANQPSSTVTPVDLATGTPEKPIRFGRGFDDGFEAIAVVP